MEKPVASACASFADAVIAKNPTALMGVEFLEAARMEGFELVLEIPFEGVWTKDEEKYYILFNKKEGVLLDFETYSVYSKNKVRGGNFYYNWSQLHQPSLFPSFHPSFGSPEEGFWAGYNNLSNFYENLYLLRESGVFLTPWKKQPSLDLLSSRDISNMKSAGDFNYPRIIKERISKLPDFVRTAILAD